MCYNLLHTDDGKQKPVNEEWFCSVHSYTGLNYHVKICILKERENDGKNTCDLYQ